MTDFIRLLAVTTLAVSPLTAQTPFHYDRRAPLGAADAPWKQVEGIEIRSVSYDSPKGGRVTGLLFLPGSAGRHPGVLLGHGAPGDSRSDGTVQMGVTLAKSGAVVLAIDAPFARRGEAPVSFTPADSADQVQLVIDSRRGIDFLTNRTDVDRSRIGYLGTSYGGAQGALLAGVERRLKAAVLRVGDGGFIAHFSDPCDARSKGAETIRGCLNWEIPESDLSVSDRERWAAAMWPVEPIHYVGHARAKLLLQSGRRDESVSPLRAARLHQAAPGSAVVEWYDAGHRLPMAATVSALRFLSRELGTQSPDGALGQWLEGRSGSAVTAAR